MRFIFSTLAISSLGITSAFAAAEGHDHLPAYAEEILRVGPVVITNSMLMVWIVAAFIVVFAQLATRKMALIPGGLQNLSEWLVESLYDFLEGILGADLVKKTFWFFGSIFILILCVNWFGLIPGVGTVGWEMVGPGADSHDKFKPFLRGGNADLNMTIAMSVTFAILWLYWAIRENGLKGFLAHIFAPKGTFNGLMKLMMIFVFGFVGVLEVISIAFRPVALSFRLYGNVFAGENILENMMLLVGKYEWLAWLPPLPFYFLEILVGLVQALVFTMLTSVFLKLICEHDDHGHDSDHNHSH